MENTGGDRAKPARETVATIGAGIRITGDVECETELQVGGQIIGDIRCETLFLDEGGAIVGKVRADRIRVAGSIEGPVDAVDLAVEATGKLVGEAAYSRLKIVPGGVISGAFVHRPINESPPETGLKLVEGTDTAPPQPRRVYGD